MRVLVSEREERRGEERRPERRREEAREERLERRVVRCGFRFCVAVWGMVFRFYLE